MRARFIPYYNSQLGITTREKPREFKLSGLLNPEMYPDQWQRTFFAKPKPKPWSAVKRLIMTQWANYI